MIRMAAILTGLLFACLLSAPASANTIMSFAFDSSFWIDTQPGGSFKHDGTGIGTLSLDVTAQKVVSVSINTTDGTIIKAGSYPGFSADSFTVAGTIGTLVFRTSDTALPGVAGQILTLQFGYFSLPYLHIGESLLTIGDESLYFFLCGGLCATRTAIGSLILRDVTATTPVPATLPLLATALGGMGLIGWRRKHQAT